MLKNQRGSSLIAVCFLIIILSAGGVYLLNLYDRIEIFQTEEFTNNKEQTIKNALQEFALLEGRYPCPAPLNSDFDTADFGIEPPDADAATPEHECAGAPVRDVDGEFIVPGRLSANVRVGAIPVRTLNLPDKYIADEYGTRFVYALTENYGNEDYVDLQAGGAITITDSTEVNHITREPGTAIFALISPRGDGNGSFDKNGNLLSACNGTGLSGQNCDFQIAGTGDASFISSSLKSDNYTDEDNYYTHNLEFAAEDCEASGEDDPFADVTFVIDSSRSMRSWMSSDDCPEETGTRCSRIEVARWAMRKIMPQVIMKDFQYAQSEGTEVQDSINVVNFVENRIYLDQPNPSKDDILASSGMDAMNFNEDLYEDFEDPALGPQTEDDFDRIDDEVDSKLNFCPDGGTPLGQHVEALAEATYEPPEDTDGRPNKIVVLTDGRHDGGDDYLLEVVRDRLAGSMDNVEIDYIDMTGRNSEILERGLLPNPDYDPSDPNSKEHLGAVYNGTNPEELIQAFASSMRTCGGTVSQKKRAVDAVRLCGDVKEPWVPPPGWTPPPKKKKKPKPPGPPPRARAS